MRRSAQSNSQRGWVRSTTKPSAAFTHRSRASSAELSAFFGAKTRSRLRTRSAADVVTESHGKARQRYAVDHDLELGLRFAILAIHGGLHWRAVLVVERVHVFERNRVARVVAFTRLPIRVSRTPRRLTREAIAHLGVELLPHHRIIDVSHSGLPNVEANVRDCGTLTGPSVVVGRDERSISASVGRVACGEHRDVSEPAHGLLHVESKISAVVRVVRLAGAARTRAVFEPNLYARGVIRDAKHKGHGVSDIRWRTVVRLKRTHALADDFAARLNADVGDCIPRWVAVMGTAALRRPIEVVLQADDGPRLEGAISFHLAVFEEANCHVGHCVVLNRTQCRVVHEVTRGVGRERGIILVVVEEASALLKLQVRNQLTRWLRQGGVEALKAAEHGAVRRRHERVPTRRCFVEHAWHCVFEDRRSRHIERDRARVHFAQDHITSGVGRIDGCIYALQWRIGNSSGGSERLELDRGATSENDEQQRVLHDDGALRHAHTSGKRFFLRENRRSVDAAKLHLDVARPVIVEGADAGRQVAIIVIIDFVAPLGADGGLMLLHAVEPFAGGLAIADTLRTKLFDLPVRVGGGNEPSRRGLRPPGKITSAVNCKSSRSLRARGTRLRKIAWKPKHEPGFTHCAAREK